MAQVSEADRTPASRDAVFPLTRWVAALIVPFLLVAAALLLIWPDQTDRLFAWTIKPRMTALFIGASFLAGGYFFTRAATARRWSAIVTGFIPVAVFAWMMAIATLLHWDRFHHNNVTFFAWVALYATTPFIVLAVWLRNRHTALKENDRAEPRLPRAFRWAAGLLGGVLILGGLAFYLRPDWMAAVWPWSLTPLTGRVIVSFLTISALAELAMARAPRWNRARVIIQGQMLGLALVLTGVARAWGDFDPSTPATWIFVGAMAVLLLANVGVYAWMESRFTLPQAERSG